MLKIILFGLLLVIIGGVFYFWYNPLTVQPQSVPNQPAGKPFKIKYGSNFNECVGYCRVELIITSEKITLHRASHGDRERYPDVTKGFTITGEEWDNLVTSVDLTKFNSLPDDMIDPDVYNERQEWIEISTETKTKKVVFAAPFVREINILVKKLRDLSKKLLLSSASDLKRKLVTEDIGF